MISAVVCCRVAAELPSSATARVLISLISWRSGGDHHGSSAAPFVFVQVACAEQLAELPQACSWLCCHSGGSLPTQLGSIAVLLA